jgi:hypothetical protein
MSLAPWQVRMIEEYYDLKQKTEALENWMSEHPNVNLGLHRMQYGGMKTYLSALKQRIQEFSKTFVG